MKKNSKNVSNINNTFITAAALVIVIIFVAILLSKGVNKMVGVEESIPTQQSSEATEVTSSQASLAHQDSMFASTAETVAGTNAVKFKIEKFKKLALQPLKFNIYGDNGQELTPDSLQVVHEKKVHFILVSANLREFQHLHPEYQNGVWNVLANMPNPGTYYAYTEFAAVNGQSKIFRNELIVRDPTSGSVNYPGLTSDLLALKNGFRTELTVSPALVGEEVTLTFKITKDNKPVADFKPYLGAYGHLILALQGDPITFSHLHAEIPYNAADGTITFQTMFMKSGRYTAFGEFNLNGKVVMFPLTFEVK